MGSNLGKETDSPSPKSLEERFNELFPYYLSIGMSYDEYWNQDCLLVKYYRKAQKLKNEQINQQEWLLGLYIYEVLGDIAPILHDFVKKGTKARPYPKEPFPISQEEVERREEKTLMEHRENLKNKLKEMSKKNNG